MPFNVASFDTHNQTDFFGGSSDGKNKTHILEIKCPYNSAIHIKYLSIIDNESMKRIASNYYAQMQSNMLINNLDKAIFVSFDPRLAHKKGLHHCEIQADKVYQDFILERVWEANEYLEEYMEKYVN